MRDDTLRNTLWSQSAFDSLLNALQRDSDDGVVKEMIADLSRRGYSATLLVKKVNNSLGPGRANRVRALSGLGSNAIAAPRRRPNQLNRRWMRRAREWWEDTLDAAYDFADWLRRLFGGH